MNPHAILTISERHEAYLTVCYMLSGTNTCYPTMLPWALQNKYQQRSSPVPVLRQLTPIGAVLENPLYCFFDGVEGACPNPPESAASVPSPTVPSSFFFGAVESGSRIVVIVQHRKQSFPACCCMSTTPRHCVKKQIRTDFYAPIHLPSFHPSVRPSIHLCRHTLHHRHYSTSSNVTVRCSTLPYITLLYLTFYCIRFSYIAVH